MAKKTILLEKLSEDEQKRAIKYIADKFHEGKTQTEIVDESGLPPAFVERYCRELDLKESVKLSQDRIVAAIYQEKAPQLKELVGLGLQVLVKSLSEILASDRKRKEIIATVRDMKILGDLISNLNQHLRLELDQSTVNVAVAGKSYEDTRVAIQELSKIDPVFNYPQLPDAGRQEN